MRAAPMQSALYARVGLYLFVISPRLVHVHDCQYMYLNVHTECGSKHGLDLRSYKPFVCTVV